MQVACGGSATSPGDQFCRTSVIHQLSAEWPPAHNAPNDSDPNGPPCPDNQGTRIYYLVPTFHHPNPNLIHLLEIGHP